MLVSKGLDSWVQLWCCRGYGMNYHWGVGSMFCWGVGRGRRTVRSGYLRGDLNVVNVEAVDNVAGDNVA